MISKNNRITDKIIESLKKVPLMKGIFPPKEETKSFEEDQPDYRYGDFRDEIKDVERMKKYTKNE